MCIFKKVSVTLIAMMFVACGKYRDLSDRTLATVTDSSKSDDASSGGTLPTSVTPSASPEVAQATLTSVKFQLLSAEQTKLPLGVVIAAKATGIYSDGTEGDISKLISVEAIPAASIELISPSIVGEATNIKAKVKGPVTVSLKIGSFTTEQTFSITDAVLTAIKLVPVADKPELTVNFANPRPVFKAIGTYSDRSSIDVSEAGSWTVVSKEIGAVTVSTAAGSRGHLKASKYSTNVSVNFEYLGLKASNPLTLVQQEAIGDFSKDSILDANETFDTASRYPDIRTFVNEKCTFKVNTAYLQQADINSGQITRDAICQMLGYVKASPTEFRTRKFATPNDNFVVWWDPATKDFKQIYGASTEVQGGIGNSMIRSMTCIGKLKPEFALKCK